MSSRLRQSALLAAVTLGTAVSCKELSVTSPPVATVAIQPQGADLFIGQSALFVATLYDAEGHQLRRTITWGSSSTTVATVSDDGRVTAMGPGVATITASADGRSGQVQVSVNTRPVATVEVTPVASSLLIGDSVQFTATAKDSDGSAVTGRTAAWAASDPGIAQVRATGWARALSVGTTAVFATVDGVRGEASLSVRAAVVAVSAIVVQPASTILALGDTTTLVARITASDGSSITGRAPAWSSSSPAVADVDGTGRVTARSTGTAIVRATLDGVTGEATVNVSASGVAQVAVSPSSITMAVGMTSPLQATLRRSDGRVITGVNVAWTSSNTNVATVVASGEVTARAVGTATITASVDGKSGSATVFVVSQPVTSIEITPATLATFAGDTLLLSAVLLDADGDTLRNRAVSWSSDNVAVASVQATGPSTQQARLIGHSAGTALITASTESRSDTSRVTVAARADLAVTKSTATPLVKAGDTVNFTLFVRNNGPSPAAGVIIRDTLPANATFVSATGSPSQSGNLLTWPTIGSLGVNGTRSFTIRLVAPAAGGFTNVGAATTTTFERNLANNRASAAVSVNPPNVTVKKTASAASVNAGGSITYTIEISNGGASPAALVEVLDSLPAGVTFVSASNGGTFNGSRVVTWPVISSIDVGQQVTYTVNVTAPLTGATLLNVARATSPSGDTDPTDNRSEATVTVNAIADLVVTKTANVSSIGPGQVIAYTITVRNAGPSPAANVIVSDNLPPAPAQVIVPSINPPGSIDSQTNVLTWPAIASLAAGGSAVFQVSVTAGPSGTVINSASATSATTDPDPASNAATVTTPIRLADVQVSKSGPASVNAAAPITWTIVLTNAGPDTAFSVVLRDSLPAGAAFVSASPTASSTSGREVLWNVASMPPGAVLMFTVNGTAPASGGTAENVARVTALTGDPDGVNNRSTSTTTIVAVADLGVTKTGTAAANPGSTISYTIGVSNAGPSAAAGVVLTDNLPAGVTFVSANPAATNVNGQVVTWDIGALAAGAGPVSFSLTVQADPAAAGTLSNTATIASTTADPASGNNTATFQTSITVANLEVTLAGPAMALETEQIVHTVKVKNAGASAAAGVVVTYTLPGNATFVSSSPQVTPAGGVLTWNAGSIAAGDSLLFAVTFTGPAGGGVLNGAAAATTTTFDGDPTNNSADLTTTVNPAADVIVSMTAAPNPVSASDTVTYTITVRNNGPSPAQAVVAGVTVPGPGAGAFVDASHGATLNGLSLQYPAFDLGAGADSVLQYRWEAPTQGSLASSVTVSAATADPVPGNNTASASPTVAAAELGIVVAAPQSVDGGDPLAYEITVSNAGPGRALGVTVTSPEPAFASYDSAVAAPASLAPLTWPIAELAAGRDTTFTVFLTASLTGAVSTVSQLTMDATVSAATQDTQAGDNSASATTTITPSNLAVSITPSAGSVAAGASITYTIVLTNNGPGTAIGVQLSGSVANGTITQGSFPQVYAVIADGASETLVLTVTAGAAGTPITVNVSATALTPDPSGASASVSTPVT